MRPRGALWPNILLAVLALGALGLGARPLSDLAGHWAEAPITALAVRGTVAGFPDGSFQPEAILTRAQTARLLVGVLNQGEAAGQLTSVSPTFFDLQNHWAAGDVEALTEIGLMRGYPDRTFRPGAPVSRLELILLAARAAGVAPLQANEPIGGSLATLLRITDAADIPLWAAPEVIAAARAGLLTNIFPGNMLRPRQPATRAEAAALLVRTADWRGGLYHLVGTVESWREAKAEFTVRSADGERVTVGVSDQTQFFRYGNSEPEPAPGDQVWVLLDTFGNAAYIEARYRDMLGSNAKVLGQEIQMYTGTAYKLIKVSVTPGAAVFLNGKPVPLAAIDGANRVYVVFDENSGGARVVDAVRYSYHGQVYSYDPAAGKLVLSVGSAGQSVPLQIDETAAIYIGGLPAVPAAIPIGATVMAAAEQGRITYLQTDP